MKQCILVPLLLLLSTPALAADQTGFTDNFATIDTNRWFVSNGWANGDHQACEWRADAWSKTDHGLAMTVSDKGGSARPIGCPDMHSKEKFSYGRYEIRLKTAAGSGLNTAFFTYIGPGVGEKEWDEIDFEFLGRDPTKVELNHIAQNTTVKGTVYPLGFDSSKDFHDYAFEWSKTGIVWFVDGKEAYRTQAGVALPRNPSLIYIDLWAGAQPEDSWMGKFTYNAPVSAYVQSVKYNPRAE